MAKERPRYKADEVTLTFKATEEQAEQVEKFEDVTLTDIETDIRVAEHHSTDADTADASVEYEATMEFAVGALSESSDARPDGRGRVMMESPSDPPTVGEDGVPAPDDDPMTDVEYDTREFEMDLETAEKVYEKVVNEIEEARKNGFDADHIVLGVPQYKALYVYVNESTTLGISDTPEAALGVEVTVVPGPQIHVVKGNERTLWEHDRRDT